MDKDPQIILKRSQILDEKEAFLSDLFLLQEYGSINLFISAFYSGRNHFESFPGFYFI